jgi:beta-N-acetylhexosaminidase
MEKILKQVGQLFVVAFRQEELSAPFLNFLEEEQIGGFILFGENCGTHASARETIRQINERLRETPSLIAIDQEGGSVCRLRGAPAEFKAAAEYGQRGNLEHFREDYARAVVLMTSMGINLNLAPVADICLEEKNECLAGRCFSHDPFEVAEYVRTSIAVSHSHGMLCCLKHFPGLGAARIDPHKDKAIAEYDSLMWEQREKIPFAAGVEMGADLIMTTHMVARGIDNNIATESEAVVSGLIRDNLGFDGVVTTDRLAMQGADGLGDPGERAVRAFMAGHDLLLFGQDFEEAAEAYEHFVGAVDSGEIPVERVQASLDRVAGLKLKLRRPVLR